ncbi:MAG: S24 family peptidase, partial [Gammaproteobacteria bacterium]
MRTEVSVETIGSAQAATCVDAEPLALRVLDDSMEPELARGCIVIVDPSVPASGGAMVLAQLEGPQGPYVVRTLRIEGDAVALRPLNSAYPP